MIGLQILFLGILLFLVPIWIGGIFSLVDKDTKNVGFQWISGQMLLWAGFQLIAVPMVLLEKSFQLVVKYFHIYMVGLLLVATV